MNTIAPGFCPDIDNRITCPCRSGIENTVTMGQPDRHRIYQNIAIIGAVEIYLAAYRWNTNTIAIAANAGNHP